MHRYRYISLLLIPLFIVLLASCDSGSSTASVNNATTASSASNANQPPTSSSNGQVANSNSAADSKSAASVNSGASSAPAAKAEPEMIMFSTTWCEICKGMRPIVSQLKPLYAGKVNFVELDREDPANAAMVKKYNITAQPIFVFLDSSGNKVNEIAGGVPRQTLQQALDKLAD